MTENKTEPASKAPNNTGRGLALGLLYGVPLGIIRWIDTDSIVFFPVFEGAGMAIGLAIGAARDNQERK